MKKLIKVLLGILIVLFVLVFGVRIYFRAPVHNYYKISKKAFVIPGIKNGFIAQGISYDKEDNLFYVTGYMKDGSASPIYIVDKKSKKLVNYVKMANEDRSEFTGHAGGLTVFDDTVYVAGSNNCCLFGFDKQALKNASKGAAVCWSEQINLISENDRVGVAFVTSDADTIYAGEFYRLPNYPTLPSHTVNCADGENHAIMIGLKKVDEKFEPVAAYSLPEKVQGLCFANGKIYVSTSYGPAFSYIYIYDQDKLTETSIELLNRKLPLYCLDSGSLCQTHKIAPMSEEIECVDGEFHIMCESASNKYIFGKFTGGRWCYKSKL